MNTSQTLVAIFMLGLTPALLWLYTYYRRDFMQPEPQKLIFKTFLYGVLVASPLLLLNKLSVYHPDWNLLQFIKNSLPGYYLPAAIFYLLVAYVEEYLKHIGMVALVERHRANFDQIVDGIEYAVAAALGFAFMENLVYFWFSYQSLGLQKSFLVIFIVRALLSTLAHSVFSGYFGYFYAHAKLDDQLSSCKQSRLTDFNRNLVKGAWKLHAFRSHIIPFRPSRSKHHPALLVAEGFFVAVLMHFVYNVLFSVKFGFYSFAYLTVPLLFLATYYLFYQFSCKVNHKLVKNPSSLVYGFLCWPERRKFIKKYGHSAEEWRELFVKSR